MPKAYTKKNIDKLRVYLESQTNGSTKTTNAKPNGGINQADSASSRSN